MTRPPKDDAPFSALAFKVMADPFVGTLTFIRIYSGECSCLLGGRGAAGTHACREEHHSTSA